MSPAPASVLIFLSTPSARRATSPRARECIEPKNFYPRPPRGGRRGKANVISTDDDFYPRPPRGGRPKTTPDRGHRLRFLSTPSARRATQREQQRRRWTEHFYPRPPRGGRHELLPACSRNVSISIHALREEGDRHYLGSLPHSTDYFYPRPPRGGRLH